MRVATAHALLIGLALVNVLSTSILVMAALRHRWAALEERASTAAILAAVAVAVPVLSLTGLGDPTVHDVLIVILLFASLLISIPSVVWLVAFLAGKFDE